MFLVYLSELHPSNLCPKDKTKKQIKNRNNSLGPLNHACVWHINNKQGHESAVTFPLFELIAIKQTWTSMLGHECHDRHAHATNRTSNKHRVQSTRWKTSQVQRFKVYYCSISAVRERNTSPTNPPALKCALKQTRRYTQELIMPNSTPRTNPSRWKPVSKSQTLTRELQI